MATLTNEQIEQKKQQLKQLTEEMNAITKELVEAGAIELSDDDLDKVSGGIDDYFKKDHWSKYYRDLLDKSDPMPKEIPEPSGEP